MAIRLCRYYDEDVGYYSPEQVAFRASPEEVARRKAYYESEEQRAFRASPEQVARRKDHVKLICVRNSKSH